MFAVVFCVRMFIDGHHYINASVSRAFYIYSLLYIYTTARLVSIDRHFVMFGVWFIYVHTKTKIHHTSKIIIGLLKKNRDCESVYIRFIYNRNNHISLYDERATRKHTKSESNTIYNRDVFASN